MQSELDDHKGLCGSRSGWKRLTSIEHDGQSSLLPLDASHFYPAIVKHLGESGLAVGGSVHRRWHRLGRLVTGLAQSSTDVSWRRIVVENPFGHAWQAAALNRQISEVP